MESVTYTPPEDEEYFPFPEHGAEPTVVLTGDVEHGSVSPFIYGPDVSSESDTGNSKEEFTDLVQFTNVPTANDANGEHDIIIRNVNVPVIAPSTPQTTLRIQSNASRSLETTLDPASIVHYNGAPIYANQNLKLLQMENPRPAAQTIVRGGLPTSTEFTTDDSHTLKLNGQDTSGYNGRTLTVDGALRQLESTPYATAVKIGYDAITADDLSITTGSQVSSTTISTHPTESSTIELTSTVDKQLHDIMASSNNDELSFELNSQDGGVSVDGGDGLMNKVNATIYTRVNGSTIVITSYSIQHGSLDTSNILGKPDGFEFNDTLWPPETLLESINEKYSDPSFVFPDLLRDEENDTVTNDPQYDEDNDNWVDDTNIVVWKSFQHQKLTIHGAINSTTDVFIAPPINSNFLHINSIGKMDGDMQHQISGGERAADVRMELDGNGYHTITFGLAGSLHLLMSSIIVIGRPRPTAANAKEEDDIDTLVFSGMADERSLKVEIDGPSIRVWEVGYPSAYLLVRIKDIDRIIWTVGASCTSLSVIKPPIGTELIFDSPLGTPDVCSKEIHLEGIESATLVKGYWDVIKLGPTEPRNKIDPVTPFLYSFSSLYLSCDTNTKVDNGPCRIELTSALDAALMRWNINNTCLQNADTIPLVTPTDWMCAQIADAGFESCFTCNIAYRGDVFFDISATQYNDIFTFYNITSSFSLSTHDGEDTIIIDGGDELSTNRPCSISTGGDADAIYLKLPIMTIANVGFGLIDTSPDICVITIPRDGSIPTDSTPDMRYQPISIINPDHYIQFNVLEYHKGDPDIVSQNDRFLVNSPKHQLQEN
jgi:hypothetical protein